MNHFTAESNNKVTLKKNIPSARSDLVYNIYTSINNSNAKIMIDGNREITIKRDNELKTIILNDNGFLQFVSVTRSYILSVKMSKCCM